jgi:hypothetical protein
LSIDAEENNIFIHQIINNQATHRYHNSLMKEENIIKQKAMYSKQEITPNDYLTGLVNIYNRYGK